MSTMDGLIDLHGVSVDIQALTQGAEDSYGDPAQVWGSRAIETVWLQRADRVASSRGASSIFISIAGRIDESDFIGFFKSDSVVQRRDFFDVGGVKYDVLIVEAIYIIGEVSHVEAHVRRRDEG